MARSTVKFLKRQGRFNTRITAEVGCDRHTVARVLAEPTDPPRRRQRAAALESWLAAEIPTTRMLELVRQDPAAPYTGGVSTFYRFVAGSVLSARRGVARDPLRGPAWRVGAVDWREARAPRGGAPVKRVFLGGTPSIWRRGAKHRGRLKLYATEYEATRGDVERLFRGTHVGAPAVAAPLAFRVARGMGSHRLTAGQ